MTRILISGACGKMGRVIARCVEAREDCTVACGVDAYPNGTSNFPVTKRYDEVVEQVDVIIDFSNPAALDDLLAFATAKKIPLVAATTGYDSEQIAKIKEAAKVIPVFFSFNMSLGVNLLVNLAKRATEILGDQFDIEIIEKHHNQKIDAPSGTALMLADGINEVLDGSMRYEYDRHSKRQKRPKQEIGIHAVRGGTIVGEHEVIFAGHDEIISLSHKAMSKEIFAVGSINAAVFLATKEPGLYDMSQMI